MTAATDFKFGRHIGSTIKDCKTGSQGLKTRSSGCILNLQAAVNNSETTEAISFLVCRQFVRSRK